MSHFVLQAYKDVMGFIVAMNDAVKGKKITGDYPVSEVRLSPIASVPLSKSMF